MKKLLVPTDFSDNAENALKFAINLANHFESKIYLLSVYQVHSPAGSLKDIDSFLRTENELQLSALVSKSKNELFQNASMEAVTVNGSTASVISNFADKRDIDLIVMGTQGSSALHEIFIGSTTVGVIKKATKAVLASPNNFSYRPFKKIVLALDESKTFPKEEISPLLTLAKSYQSKVLVYHIAEPGGQNGVSPSIHEYLKGTDYSVHEKIGITDINEGINDFVRENDADLLCMIARKRSFLENLFDPSVTRREAFDSPVALLVLQRMG